jgi:hypothetical protein
MQRRKCIHKHVLPCNLQGIQFDQYIADRNCWILSITAIISRQFMCNKFCVMVHWPWQVRLSMCSPQPHLSLASAVTVTGKASLRNDLPLVIVWSTNHQFRFKISWEVKGTIWERTILCRLQCWNKCRWIGLMNNLTIAIISRQDVIVPKRIR